MASTPCVPSEYWSEIEDLYLDYRDAMVMYARRLLGSERSLAHDLVQETFQDAALRWGALRVHSEDRKRAWLYRVLKNKAFDHWGTAGRRVRPAEDYDAAADLDTPRVAVSNLLLSKCWKVIDSMPAAQRRVALLKWQGEWTSGEIAAHLGIAQATVRVHVCRARRDLADALGDEVVFPSEWAHDAQGEEATG